MVLRGFQHRVSFAWSLKMLPEKYSKNWGKNLQSVLCVGTQLANEENAGGNQSHNENDPDVEIGA
jgi:hypothetical protein